MVAGEVPNPLDFRATESRYFELKGRLDAGAITQQEFEKRLRELLVTDAGGRTWTIGAQTGQWYYADGENWVPGTPPDLAAPPSQPLARSQAPAEGYVPPPPARGRSLLWPVAGGCFVVGLCGAALAAAAVFLPQGPLRAIIAPPTATPVPTVRVVTATPAPAPPTATPLRPTVTAIVPTATAMPRATRTPVAPTATATRPAATATASPTATRVPPSATATRIPPTATKVPPTATPLAPSPIGVTLTNPHYERWGRPTSANGCEDYNNGSPVRKLTFELNIHNNGSQALISYWPSFRDNIGNRLAECAHGYSAGDKALPAIQPGRSNTVTFFTFTNEGTWVSSVQLYVTGRTWAWTLGPDGQIWSYP